MMAEKGVIFSRRCGTSSNGWFSCRLMAAMAGILLFQFLQVFGQTGHRVLVSGAGLGYVAVVSPAGTIEWKHNESNQTNDSWVLPNGNVVFSYQNGVKIVTPDFSNPANNKVVWNRQTKVIGGVQGETHSCQPLDGGSSRFLVGESYDTISYIVEVDTTNKEWKRIALPRFGSGKHNQFRQIRKTPQNTYLVTQQTGGGKAFEYDSTGKLLRTFPDGRYSAVRLANGNTLIGCGDAHRAIEVDSSNKIVWEVTQNQVATQVLGFVAEVLRLQNGNTVLCNWTGHGIGSGAPVIEINANKQLVWSLTSTIANSVSSVKIIADKDTIKPAVIKASAPSSAQKTITITFSKPIDSQSAVSIANYSLSQGITVESAQLRPDLKTVDLTIGIALSTGTTCTITMNNLKDRAFPANLIKPGSSITVDLGLVNAHKENPLNRPPVAAIGHAPVKVSVYNLQGQLEYSVVMRENGTINDIVNRINTSNFSIRSGTHVVSIKNHKSVLRNCIVTR